MKKFFAILLTVCLLLSLCACSKTEKAPETPLATPDLSSNQQTEQLPLESDTNVIVEEEQISTEGESADSHEETQHEKSVEEKPAEATDNSSELFYIDVAKQITMTHANPVLPDSEQEIADKQAYWEDVLYNNRHQRDYGIVYLNMADIYTMAMGVDCNNISILRISGLANGNPAAVEIYGHGNNYTYYHHLIEKGDVVSDQWKAITSTPSAEDIADQYGVDVPVAHQFNKETDKIKYIGSKDGIDYVSVSSSTIPSNMNDLVFGMDPEKDIIYTMFFSMDGYSTYVEYLDTTNGILRLPEKTNSEITFDDAMLNFVNILMAIAMSNV